MIDKDTFYWACRRHGLAKLAKVIGITPTGIQKKMYNPTRNFKVSEYITICQTLHPKMSLEKSMSIYIRLAPQPLERIF